MQPLPDLATLSDDDLDELIRSLKEEEEAVSMRRRFLHGQIDLLRTERNARLRALVEAGAGDSADADLVAATVVAPAEAVRLDEEIDTDARLEPLPDLSTLTMDEVRLLIRELEREEDRISLERRLLHGRIDILSAERLLRDHAATDPGPQHVDVERLKEILSKRLLAPRGDEAT